jgi:hypothetical protein
LSTFDTFACTMPSIRSPPEKTRSPSTVVPAPIRLSSRFCVGRVFLCSIMEVS